MNVEDLVNQMDLIKTVNNAKCVTRVDMTSCYKVEGFEDGLMVGFRWILTYVKLHWLELTERVTNDSLLERSTEKARFEALRFKSAPPSPTPGEETPRRKSALGSSASPSYTASLGSTAPPLVSGSLLNRSDEPVMMTVLPQRLDPEGGNDEKEWKLDAAHQMTHQPDTEDEYPEVVIVESRAEVHTYRSRSASAAVSLKSTTVIPMEAAIFSAEAPIVSSNGTRSATEKMSNKLKLESRPKLFRNKTAPIPDQPIRIPITANKAANKSIEANSASRV